jgi:hypothetical protein
LPAARRRSRDEPPATHDIEIGRRGAENAFPPIARTRWRAEIVYLDQSCKVYDFEESQISANSSNRGRSWNVIDQIIVS